MSARIAAWCAGAALAWAAIMGCQWDRQSDSPYLPGSQDYVGDEWTHDGDGDGIADSVEKYVPGCALPPAQCLRNSRILKDIPPDRYGLRAGDLLLWQGEGPMAASLSWSPPEAALRSHALTSSDTDIVAVRGDTLVPKTEGRCRIQVYSPGPGILRTEFGVKVASRKVRVKSLRAADLVLRLGADTLPGLQWDPPDATYKDYSLAIAPESIAVFSGDRIRGLRPGRAQAVVLAADGNIRAEFSVLVLGDTERTIVNAEPLHLVAGDSSIAPKLTWNPPAAAQWGYRLSLLDTSSILALTPDAQKVVPLRPGTASVHLASTDGLAQADFQVTVEGDSNRDPNPKPDPDPKPNPDSVTGIVVAPVSLSVGGSQAPAFTWTPATARKPAYMLAMEDPTIASAVALDSGARVLGLHPGKTQAVLRLAGGLSAAFSVTVVPMEIVVASIQTPDFVLDAHAPPYTPVVTFTPAEATNKSYALIAADAAGAFRIEANQVVPVRTGKSPLRVVPQGNPAAAVVCTVTVTSRLRGVLVKSDTLKPAEDRLSLAGRVTWVPADASDKSFRLTSLAPAIVSIAPGDTGYHAVGPGTAKLVLRAQDSSHAVDTFSVTVRIPMTQLIAKDLTMRVGDPVLNPWFLFTFVPANATNQGWSFEYRDPAASPPPQNMVGIVDHWKLQAVGPGKTQLIAFSLDNNAIQDTFMVTVVQPVKSLAADTSAPVSLRVGQPDLIPPITVLPADATVRTWHLVSTNPAVVSVSGTAALHAVKPGATTVTAVSDDNPQISINLSVMVRIGP